MRQLDDKILMLMSVFKASIVPIAISAKKEAITAWNDSRLCLRDFMFLRVLGTV